MEEARHNNQIVKRKTKGASLFPKLNRVEISPVQPKLITRGMGKKYSPQNIFKVKEERPQLKCLRIGMDEDWVLKSKQYQQMEIQMIDCRRRHQEDIVNLNKVKQQKEKDIDSDKKTIHDIKVALWEMKSQIFQLNTALKDQEEEYERLLNQLGYQQGDPEQEEHYQDQNNQIQAFSQQNHESQHDLQSANYDSRNQVYSTQAFRDRSQEEQS